MITICHQNIILVSVTKCPQMKLHQLEEMSNHLSNKSQEVKDHFYFKLKIRHILEIIRRTQIIRWPIFYDMMIFNTHSHIIIDPCDDVTVLIWRMSHIYQKPKIVQLLSLRIVRRKIKYSNIEILPHRQNVPHHQVIIVLSTNQIVVFYQVNLNVVNWCLTSVPQEVNSL